jgi:hypothetical protein
MRVGTINLIVIDPEVEERGRVKGVNAWIPTVQNLL